MSMPEHARATWLASSRAEKPELADSLQGFLDEHRALCEERFLERSLLADAAHSIIGGQNIGAYKRWAKHSKRTGIIGRIRMPN